MTSVPAPARSWKRLDGVDLLRGLAILFVLMNHVNMQLLFGKVPYTRGLPQQLVSSLVWNGQYGVQMFFAVSGFLITSTSLRRWGSLDAVKPRDFYLVRFARIAPLLLLLLTILSILHLTHINHFVIKPKVASLGGALIAALTFRINLLEAARGYLPGNWDILWSLSVEEMFYFFFPLACLLLRRTSLFVAALLIFVVLGPFGRTVLTHGNQVWHEYSYLGSMDAIALGCLTALIAAQFRMSRAALWGSGLLGGACLGFVLLLSRTAQEWGLEKTGLDMTVVAIGTCLLIAVAAETRWRRWRVLAPVQWLGERSYEIYLSHMFLVIALYTIFSGWLGKPLKGVPLLFASVIITAGLFGELLSRLYSEPMNRLLRKRLGGGERQLGSVMNREELSTMPLTR